MGQCGPELQTAVDVSDAQQRLKPLGVDPPRLVA